MTQTKQTPLYGKHVAFGARIVDFSGWQMPIQYPDGIVAEHLATRKHAGLFDVSHMGRFQITGSQAAVFLRRVLTSDCAKLAAGQAQYTMLANEDGGAIDDAFLYCPEAGVFLLVVNASNKDKDWAHLQGCLAEFPEAAMEDVSEEVAMIALQGPDSEAILESLVTGGTPPEAKRNAVGVVTLAGVEVLAARTGYTGEPVCFELFIPASSAGAVWDKLAAAGATPVGLGARDTLRLEAGLPLYDHELGMGQDGHEIPIFTIGLAAFAVSFEDRSRDFIGRAALEEQAAAKKRYQEKDFSAMTTLPKVVRQIRLVDKGIAREGATVYYDGAPVGWVSSGTMVPYWKHAPAQTDCVTLTDEHAQRAVGLCIIDPHVRVGSEIEVEVRGRRLKAAVVARNLENRNSNLTYALV